MLRNYGILRKESGELEWSKLNMHNKIYLKKLKFENFENKMFHYNGLDLSMEHYRY